jgi:hypothetical protein
MNNEPTEMAGVAEAETGSIYAWGLDYDDPDEFASVPVALTPRRITALGIAASLVLVALAGAVAVVAMRQPVEQSEITPAPVTTTVSVAPVPTVTVTAPPPPPLPPPPVITSTMVVPTPPPGSLIYEGQSCWGYEGDTAYSSIEGYEMLCNDGYPHGSLNPPVWVGNDY